MSHIMTKRTMSHRLLFSWFALLLSVCATGDIVIDLLEEEANLAAASESLPAAVEIENALENLLFPSVREGSTAVRLHHALVAIDLDLRGIDLHLPTKPDSSSQWPARAWIPPYSSPSSLIPLRI